MNFSKLIPDAEMLLRDNFLVPLFLDHSNDMVTEKIVAMKP